MGQNITLLEESQAFPSRPSDSSSISRQAKPGNLLRIVKDYRTHTDTLHGQRAVFLMVSWVTHTVSIRLIRLINNTYFDE